MSNVYRPSGNMIRANQLDFNGYITPTWNMSDPQAYAWAVPSWPTGNPDMPYGNHLNPVGYPAPNAQAGWTGLQLQNPTTPSSIAGMYGPTPPGYMGAGGYVSPPGAPGVNLNAPGYSPNGGMPAPIGSPGPQPQTVPIGAGPGLPGGGMTSPMAPSGVPVAPTAAGTPMPAVAQNPTVAVYGNQSVNMPQSISGKTQAQLMAEAGPLNDKINTQQQIDNAQTLGAWQVGIAGANTLGQLGMGIYSLYKAADAYDFQKGLAQRNLTNQASSYNAAMEDRLRGRHSADYNNTHQAEIQSQIDNRKMSDKITY